MLISNAEGPLHWSGRQTDGADLAIISLTSIPPRFDMLGQTLERLRQQSADIREIRVNIPRSYRRFPEGSFSLPSVPEGVRVVQVDHDYGPATKLLPTLHDLAGSDEPIIFCDDCMIMPPTWAQGLLDAAARQPDKCIANAGWDLDLLGLPLCRDEVSVTRAIIYNQPRNIRYRFQRLQQKLMELREWRRQPKPFRERVVGQYGHLDIMEGYGGVLVKSRFFGPEVFNVPERLWPVDDIWLSGMASYHGTMIWGSNGAMPREMPGHEKHALAFSVIEGLNRDQANLECVRYLQHKYGIWREEVATSAESP